MDDTDLRWLLEMLDPPARDTLRLILSPGPSHIRNYAAQTAAETQFASDVCKSFVT